MGYELNDVSVKLNGVEILQSVSCTLQEGKWISVIGHTGAGKSTFAKVMKGLVPFYRGEYTHDRQPLPRDSKGNMKAVPQIGYVFQYPEQQLFATTVYRELAFALTVKGESPGKVEAAVKTVMEQLGLPADLLQEKPFQLSGGLKRLVAVASVLITEPELLILDEPTAGLDSVHRTALLKQLQVWQREKNRTVLLISHQLEEVADYSDEVMVFQKGHLLAHLEANELFLKCADLLEQAGLPLPEPVQLLRLIEGISGRTLTPASCREEDIMQLVRNVWQSRGLHHEG
ncbi:ATP-binding cassette domain-containing protein [Paenibacillus sp. LMG 31459]|uniref:ATP-binding cassette domain-containing protein n=1 Tax=Paenibacillus phytohabitans TaxID=2654978 RepID=A0ABX1YBA6_9BACL|nr:ATP-binding cassette domain-containing protein [Paenibacillus phytohabitans]NOU78056.1 ATP-binding cassette domain-containing protein [Paenibacillus phytohabitans]